MGPGVFVCSFSIPNSGYLLVVELRSSNHRLFVYRYAATELETAAATTVTCPFLIRLLATSKEDSAHIQGYPNAPVPISGPRLSHFFQESQDTLRKVTLKYMLLNGEKIHALATTESRPDMEVILQECILSDDNGAAFVECLRHDRGRPSCFRVTSTTTSSLPHWKATVVLPGSS
jgi:hypothetical protein